MKKISMLILAILLVCLIAIPAGAARSAFEKITVSSDYPVVTDAENPEDKKPAGFVEGFGIGNTWIDDVAAFTDLDFGTTGASTATIGFAFGAEDGGSTLLMYLDSLDSAPIATFKTVYSGGWDTESVKDYTQNVNIPAGTHTVYVKWTDDTGSLHTIQFGAGSAAGAETDSETAPKAADMGMVSGVFALVLSGAAVLGLKKKR